MVCAVHPGTFTVTLPMITSASTSAAPVPTTTSRSRSRPCRSGSVTNRPSWTSARTRTSEPGSNDSCSDPDSQRIRECPRVSRASTCADPACTNRSNGSLGAAHPQRARSHADVVERPCSLHLQRAGDHLDPDGQVGPHPDPQFETGSEALLDPARDLAPAATGQQRERVVGGDRLGFAGDHERGTVAADLMCPSIATVATEGSPTIRTRREVARTITRSMSGTAGGAGFPAAVGPAVEAARFGGLAALRRRSVATPPRGRYDPQRHLRGSAECSVPS